MQTVVHASERSLVDNLDMLATAMIGELIAPAHLMPVFLFVGSRNADAAALYKVSRRDQHLACSCFGLLD
jgi:hypothetical protein